MMQKQPPVTNPAPYPPCMVEHQNSNYARQIMQAFASDKSETTAVHQYLYQSWILMHTAPDLSDLIQRISKVEMHHMQLLGQLIFLLGGNPRCCAFQQNNYIPWNGNMLNYSHSQREILKANIASEEYAHNTYVSLSKQIHDAHIAPLMLRLSLDEKLHVQLFQQCLEHLKDN